MKSHETAFHVINCHVPVCHAVVPSRKWTMWLFRYVIVISYKCSITSTEVAPFWWHVCVSWTMWSTKNRPIHLYQVFILSQNEDNCWRRLSELWKSAQMVDLLERGGTWNCDLILQKTGLWTRPISVKSGLWAFRFEPEGASINSADTYHLPKVNCGKSTLTNAYLPFLHLYFHFVSMDPTYMAIFLAVQDSSIGDLVSD